MNVDADADAEEDADVEAARLEAYGDPRYWDLLDAIQRKHPAYDLEVRNGLLLDQGIGIAVFVDPGKRMWQIHRAGSAAIALRDGDRFEVPDVLPGFSVAVDELWPE